jgi:prepilin-type N-terminal cleavage/methylation domain-containing protein
MQNRNRHQAQTTTQGFTLTESVVAVAIVGSLAAIATPKYFGQIQANCQRQSESSISRLLSQTQAYYDEYSETPTGWSDLDRIASIQTTNGPASGNSFETVVLPGCNYELTGNSSGDIINFESKRQTVGSNPIQGTDSNVKEESKSNTIGCINTLTGMSDIRRGDGKTSASQSDLKCG